MRYLIKINIWKSEWGIVATTSLFLWIIDWSLSRSVRSFSLGSLTPLPPHLNVELNDRFLTPITHSFLHLWGFCDLTLRCARIKDLWTPYVVNGIKYCRILVWTILHLIQRSRYVGLFSHKDLNFLFIMFKCRSS